MRFYPAYISFLIALSFLGRPVLANEESDFSKLIEQPSEQNLVLDAAKRSPVVLQHNCPLAKFTVLNQFSIYKQLKFDGFHKLIAGAWQQTVMEDGCGEVRFLKVLVLMSPQNNEMKAFPLFPGNTRADPTLQKDAIKYAVVAASSPEIGDCKTVYVANTEFLRETGKAIVGARGKPWDELWTLSLCTKKALVTMHFIPDSTGTTIRAILGETKFLPTNSAR